MDKEFDVIEAEFGITGFGVGAKVVSEIISAAIRHGIFERELYEKYNILTSRGIQQRYFAMVDRRRNVAIIDDYSLIQVDKNLVAVASYCTELKSTIDPLTFVNDYETNGWMHGRSHIKDWKDCVRTWQSRESSTPKRNQSKYKYVSEAELARMKASMDWIKHCNAQYRADEMLENEGLEPSMRATL